MRGELRSFIKSVSTEVYLVTGVLTASALYVLFGKRQLTYSNRSSSGSAQQVPSGLANLGRTCFFNAVLQALASCKVFCAWINARARNAPDQTSFVYCLHRMIYDVNHSGENNSDTQLLARLLDMIRQCGWVVESSEHDAHELFHAVVSMISSDLNSPEIKSVLPCLDVEDDINNAAVYRGDIMVPNITSTIPPLQGYLSSSMRCKVCLKKVWLYCDTASRFAIRLNANDQFVNIWEAIWSKFSGVILSWFHHCQTITKYDNFTSLSLVFPPSQATPLHLEDFLRFYFLSDNLVGVNCEHCTKSEDSATIVQTDHLKELTIGRSPNCLCLHIQRLGWYGHHETMKRHDKVIFPSLLDVGPFTQLQRMINQFQLVAVIEHLGSESSGHFITYRKIIQDDRHSWICTSDLDVYEVTAEHVHNRSPYMLFYEKISCPSAP